MGNHELWTEIGQLTVEYEFSKEDVKNVLDNFDCSFDTHKFLEDTYQSWVGEKTLPKKSGWYWILIDGYDDPTPCWFSLNQEIQDSYFLPGGMGDGSRNGIYLDEIVKIGPEITVPKF